MPFGLRGVAEQAAGGGVVARRVGWEGRKVGREASAARGAEHGVVEDEAFLGGCARAQSEAVAFGAISQGGSAGGAVRGESGIPEESEAQEESALFAELELPSEGE